jgi:hypothetical protein
MVLSPESCRQEAADMGKPRDARFVDLRMRDRAISAEQLSDEPDTTRRTGGNIHRGDKESDKEQGADMRAREFEADRRP